MRSATVRIGSFPRVSTINAVRAQQLSGLFARAAERADVLAVLVVLIDVAGAVSVADIEVAVRREREIGRAVFLLAPSAPGLYASDSVGIAEAEHFLAVQRGLHNHRALGVAKVKEFVLAFFRDMQAVRAALEILAPGSSRTYLWRRTPPSCRGFRWRR